MGWRSRANSAIGSIETQHGNRLSLRVSDHYRAFSARSGGVLGSTLQDHAGSTLALHVQESLASPVGFCLRHAGSWGRLRRSRGHSLGRRLFFLGKLLCLREYLRSHHPRLRSELGHDVLDGIAELDRAGPDVVGDHYRHVADPLDIGKGVGGERAAALGEVLP